MDAYLAGEKSLPDATKIYLQNIVPGLEIAAFSARHPVSNPTKPGSNPLFFIRSESEISSQKSSRPSSKSAKSESKIGQIHPENTSEQIVESVYGRSDLFVPLTQPAR
jgi:hypothetical protein